MEVQQQIIKTYRKMRSVRKEISLLICQLNEHPIKNKSIVNKLYVKHDQLIRIEELLRLLKRCKK